MKTGRAAVRTWENDSNRAVCAHRFSFLDSSWDWSWYDPQALDGFEDLTVEAYAPNRNLPSVFAGLIAHLFCMQRDYVNRIASGE